MRAGSAIDPAHLAPGKGGYDHVDPCRPALLARSCHDTFDLGELSLLEHMADSEASAKATPIAATE